MRPDHPHLRSAATSAGRLTSTGGFAAARAGDLPQHRLRGPAVLPDERRRRKLRRCLQCRDDFLSEGAGDRICPDCEAANARLLEGCYMAQELRHSLHRPACRRIAADSRWGDHGA